MKYTFLLFNLFAIVFGTNAQNVGIGTPIPSYLLTVQKDGIGISQQSSTGVGQIGFFTYPNLAFIQTNDNTDMEFATNNGVAQMTLQKTTGNFGIGQITPTQKLDVTGNANLTGNITIGGTVRIAGGTPGTGKVLTSSDASGNATWQAAPVVNQQLQASAFNLSTTTQDAEVDFPTTNVTATATGTYLITYYVDAYNTFTLNCLNACSTPVVYYTNAILYNKTTASPYQTMTIDFSLQDHNNSGATSIVTFSCPAHQVSGNVVSTLNAGDLVGIKMRSLADDGASAEIRIRSCTVTLVRLY